MIAPVQDSDNPALKAAIRQAIAQAPAGRITFARFMEMALYYPGEGYYTHRGGLLGVRGDFYTAPHLSPAFGQLIARQLVEFWENMGAPAAFHIVEGGAGQGLLAGDILSFLRQNAPRLWPGLSYSIVEISEPLRLAQRRRLSAIPDGAELIEKVGWRDLAGFGPGEVEGVILSNELLDAFPVHLVVVEPAGLREIYVTADPASSEFVETVGPLSTPELLRYFERLGLDLHSYGAGYRTEVNLGALDWLSRAAASLGRGYLLTVDYGYTAERRYHPLRRAGTLQCYTAHTVHNNPYVNVGTQDITAHVDFTSLMRQGEASGLKNEGFTNQALFLSGLGLGDRLALLSDPVARPPGMTTKQKLAEREALHRLINPNGMGNFGVVILSKNIPPSAPPLTGVCLKLLKHACATKKTSRLVAAACRRARSFGRP
jgi:SAM-dependent MidA family methyltransferase